MRQQTFQKALSRLTDTGFRLFFVTGLVFAVLTGLYNIWLCMAELVVLLVLYLYFQSGAIRRKQEAMDYLDHLASGVDNASRRTMLSSPMPIAIFRPDTDDIIWSNERFLHLTGDPDHPPWSPPFSASGCWTASTSARSRCLWEKSSTWSTATWSAPGSRTAFWPRPIGWT